MSGNCIKQDIIESDDKNYGFEQVQINECYPEPSEIYLLFKTLESSKAASLKLEWTCAGKRELTPDNSHVSQNSINDLCDISESLDQSDFDFEKDISHINLKHMDGKKELKGCAKKRLLVLMQFYQIWLHKKLDNML